MGTPVVRTTTSVDFPSAITVAELKAILALVPGTAWVRFTVHPGDQRDPSYTTMTVAHP